MEFRNLIMTTERNSPGQVWSMARKSPGQVYSKKFPWTTVRNPPLAMKKVSYSKKVPRTTARIPPTSLWKKFPASQFLFAKIPLRKFNKGGWNFKILYIRRNLYPFHGTLVQVLFLSSYSFTLLLLIRWSNIAWERKALNQG